MKEYRVVDLVELLKEGGLEPLEDGRYGEGYTGISPPTKIGRGVIKPQHFDFFEALRSRLPIRPEEFQTRRVAQAWYEHEREAPREVLESYAIFKHVAGRKSA